MDTNIESVKERLTAVRNNIHEGCKLVAVSKYHPAGMIQACYDLGQRIFGESHEQEIREKHAALPKDIDWHFIGHLQTNKVKYIAPYIRMIEAVDSPRLLREIEKQASRVGTTIDVLLEIKTAQEDTKYGFTIDECRQMLKDGEWRGMRHVRICGLMTIATNTDDKEQIRREFTEAADFFDEVKMEFFPDEPSFSERSWGMSDDYDIAQECRSTMVRIGTAIFGERHYV
ncbi:MAG: YggS family pyridoxal phosphate-dependent enzyme [Prevotella sp.]